MTSSLLRLWVFLYIHTKMSLFQNPMVFPQALGKCGLKPAFSRKSKVAVPKLKFWNSLKYLDLRAAYAV
jgi:hypothetical protein